MMDPIEAAALLLSPNGRGKDRHAEYKENAAFAALARWYYWQYQADVPEGDREHLRRADAVRVARLVEAYKEEP